jgi:hypothetical protein
MLKSPLLVTFATVVLLTGCTQRTVRSARFVDSPSGVQLEYTLKAAHAYLAEYDRALHVTFDHNHIDFPLEKDTGGYLLMNIHRLPDRRLLLVDGLAHIVIDPQRETVEEVITPANASGAEYVGCFDWPQGGVFGFIPAVDRPEKKRM